MTVDCLISSLVLDGVEGVPQRSKVVYLHEHLDHLLIEATRRRELPTEFVERQIAVLSGDGQRAVLSEQISPRSVVADATIRGPLRLSMQGHEEEPHAGARRKHRVELSLGIDDEATAGRREGRGALTVRRTQKRTAPPLLRRKQTGRPY